MNRILGALGVCADGVRRFLAQRSRPRGHALALAAGILLSGMGASRVVAQAASNGAAPAVMMQDTAALGKLLPGTSRRPAPDLFGFTTLKLGRTLYDKIWREAAWSPLPVGHAELDAVLSRLRTLPVRERVDEANAWINARETYAPDRFVINHQWGNLAKVLSEGCGEREAVAIAKLQLLAATGVSRRDMYLVLVQDWHRVADDYLLVVRDGDRLYVLGGKQDSFEDASQAGRYVPLLAFSADGAWIFGRKRSGHSGGMNVSVANLRGVLGYSAAKIPAVRTQRPPTISCRRPGDRGFC